MIARRSRAMTIALREPANGLTHLAGVVLSTDWQRDFDLPADLVKGGVLCSGLYDLKPEAAA